MDGKHNALLAERQAAGSWPAELDAVFERFLTAEYASLTARGAPVTYPVTPYIGESGATLDLSTGLAYPAKAERARRNPQVALLFSDPTGSGLTRPPVVLVQGYAHVRDADLQGNTDRYLRLSRRKTPATYRMMPPALLRRIPWYLARIWVNISPVRMWWWPEGRLDREPQRWQAPAGLHLPASDPPPVGPALGAWKPAPQDWRQGLARALRQLGLPVVTVCADDGFPLPLRARRVEHQGEAVVVELPAGAPPCADGPACLTFHHHPEVFTGQQHMVFAGALRREGAGAVVRVERQLGDWSLGATPSQTVWSFLWNGRTLARRVEAEARRRGQPVPTIGVADRP